MSILKHISWNQQWTFKLRRPVKFLFSRGIRKEWVFKLIIGPGAGYILGRTFYVAHNCIEPIGGDIYRPKRWQIGFTNNANKVPYTRH